MRACSLAIWRLLRASLDELTLAGGLLLATIALWHLVSVLALLLPGLVLTWLALPSRRPFVIRTPSPADKKRIP